MPNKKALFIVHHRLDRSPGQRYRFEQFFSFLEENGIECHLSNILTEAEDKTLYTSRNVFKKALIALRAYKKRYKNLREINNYDLIVIYREALMTRSIYFEKMFYKKGIPLVFDFDDAIWVKDVSHVNRFFSWFKDENKIKKILPLCAHVTCGNQYLKDFALKYNQNVTILPSTVDLSIYKKIPSQRKNVTIGWVGSHTTIKHFEKKISVYIKLKEKYKEQIDFVVIGDEHYENKKLGIKGIKWETKKEVELFNSFDIGIMPLPDDEWSNGKCAMKALLYMSTETVSVVSPVGVNKKIITHGENGYLAKTEKDWFEVICNLIEDKELRQNIGRNGRETILKKYSKRSQQENYLKLYRSLIK